MGRRSGAARPEGRFVNGGAYDRALEEARRELAAAVPGVVSAAAGVAFEAGAGGGEGIFRFALLGSQVGVTYPAGLVSEGGREALVAPTIVVLHYLARSAGPLDLDDPVRFQGFPGANAYVAAFRAHAEAPLLRRFGEDPEAYVAAARALGGAPLEIREAPLQAAEEMWRLPFLPHLPLGLRLGLAEDGLPADCVMVFPRRAGYVYHLEDLAVAGEILSARLLAAAGASGGFFAAGSGKQAEPAEVAVLATVYDPMEAEIIVSRLRSAGIEAALRHDALATVYGLTFDGLGRNDILVRVVDLEEARAALETEEGGM